MSDVISVYTQESVEAILAAGGTQSWKLDRNRASRCDYVVIYRNANPHSPERPEPHGFPFMVGKVKDVVPSTERPDRWLIQISEYALVKDNPEEEWEGRNPVAYWTDSEYKTINFKKLDYQPLENLPRGLTISEAKARLAIGLNVPESAIEIIVRS